MFCKKSSNIKYYALNYHVSHKFQNCSLSLFTYYLSCDFSILIYYLVACLWISVYFWIVLAVNIYIAEGSKTKITYEKANIVFTFSKIICLNCKLCNMIDLASTWSITVISDLQKYWHSESIDTYHIIGLIHNNVWL